MDELHEWMMRYWNAQVRNPDAVRFLPDGLGGVKLVNVAIGNMKALKAAPHAGLNLKMMICRPFVETNKAPSFCSRREYDGAVIPVP